MKNHGIILAREVLATPNGTTHPIQSTSCPQAVDKTGLSVCKVRDTIYPFSWNKNKTNPNEREKRGKKKGKEPWADVVVFKFPLEYNTCTHRHRHRHTLSLDRISRDDTLDSSLFFTLFLFSRSWAARGRSVDMAAWFVVTIPTAAYEQKLLADRDRHAEAERERHAEAERNGDASQQALPQPATEEDNVTGVLSLGLVQASTLLQNRRQDAGQNSLSPEPASKFSPLTLATSCCLTQSIARHFNDRRYFSIYG